MDFSDLYGEINSRLHGTTADTKWLAEIKKWANLARKQIVSLNPNWDFLQATDTATLVNGQVEYSLNAELTKINPWEVRLTTTKTRLVFAESKDFDLVLADPTTPGTPTHFTLAGYQKIQLYPPPNASAVSNESSITYEYTKTFNTDMSADADLHGLPIHFEPILLDLAESMGWMYLRNPQHAQFAWSRAMASLQAYVPDNEFIKMATLNVSPPMVSDKPEQLLTTGRGRR